MLLYTKTSKQIPMLKKFFLSLLVCVLTAGCSQQPGPAVHVSQVTAEVAGKTFPFTIEPNSKEFWIMELQKEIHRADSLQGLVDLYQTLLSEDSVDGIR